MNHWPSIWIKHDISVRIIPLLNHHVEWRCLGSLSFSQIYPAKTWLWGRALPEGHSHPETPNRILQPTPSLNITQSIKSQQMTPIFIYCRPLGKKNCWLFLSPKNTPNTAIPLPSNRDPFGLNETIRNVLFRLGDRVVGGTAAFAPKLTDLWEKFSKFMGSSWNSKCSSVTRNYPCHDEKWQKIKLFFTQPNYRLFGTEKGPNLITGPKKWVPKRLHQKIVRCQVFG